MTISDGGTVAVGVKAPAKINVGLHILGLRPDGYHEIRTVLQQINLADEILLEDAPDLSLSLTGDRRDLPAGEKNLCMKAALLLRRRTGCPKGARIKLNKVIPIGAGLGGGSSDAAATLKALNQMWQTGLDQPTLMDLAAELGSDVPFFIAGGCCLAMGRGEILTQIDPIIRDQIVLICPNLRISTARAYENIGNYRLTSQMENIIFQNSLRKDLSNPEFYNTLTNDFESLVFAHYPVLEKLKKTLLMRGAYYSSLSGSGSALYGVFASSEKAKRASEEIQIKGKIYLLEP